MIKWCLRRRRDVGGRLVLRCLGEQRGRQGAKFSYCAPVSFSGGLPCALCAGLPGDVSPHGASCFTWWRCVPTLLVVDWYRLLIDGREAAWRVHIKCFYVF